MISPVGVLHYKGADFQVADGQTGPLAQRLFDELMAIQYGTQADPFGWITEGVPVPQAATPQVVSVPRPK